MHCVHSSAVVSENNTVPDAEAEEVTVSDPAAPHLRDPIPELLPVRRGSAAHSGRYLPVPRLCQDAAVLDRAPEPVADIPCIYAAFRHCELPGCCGVPSADDYERVPVRMLERIRDGGGGSQPGRNSGS